MCTALACPSLVYSFWKHYRSPPVCVSCQVHWPRGLRQTHTLVLGDSRLQEEQGRGPRQTNCGLICKERSAKLSP